MLPALIRTWSDTKVSDERKITLDIGRVIELAHRASLDDTGIMCDDQYEVEIVDAEQGIINLVVGWPKEQ